MKIEIVKNINHLAETECFMLWIDGNAEKAFQYLEQAQAAVLKIKEMGALQTKETVYSEEV